MLVIALCDWAVTPTRRPAATSARICRAPVQVLPVPGGPWIAIVVSSRSSARRTRGVEDRLAGSSERFAVGDAGDARREALEQVADGAVRPGPVIPWARTWSATAAERLGERLRS